MRRPFRIALTVTAAELRSYNDTCHRLGLDRAEFLRAGARLLMSQERRAAREETGTRDAGVAVG
jgi:hypothetical protein